MTKSAKLYLKTYVFFLSYAILWRLAFLTIFRRFFETADMGELWQAFYIGMKFDARLAALFTLPMLIYLLIPRLNLLATTLGKFFYDLLVGGLFVFTTIAYIFDIGTYAYIKVRLSSSLLDFLATPFISFKLVWQSYPVIPLAIFILVIYFVGWLIQRRFIRCYLNDFKKGTFRQKAFSFIICFFVFAGTLYGKFSYYPLRWAEAYFSTNTVISNFALNPVLHFYNTLKFQEKEFDRKKVEEYYDELAEFLEVPKEQRDIKTLNFVRRFAGRDIGEKPNIVIIVLESLSANKTSLFDNELDPTPKLNELARESVFFTRFFTPTESTARSIFATVTGSPDVTKGKSSSRNPNVIDQHSIMGSFDNYDKMYFLGGSANWGHIRGIFSHNVKGIEIYEEGFYSSPRIDVWGISDLDLFKEAHQVLLTKTKKPFFAFIQSAGFHRPYTIPQSNEGFVPRKFKKKKILDNGFESNDELNSITFQDHALGHFMKLAKSSEYYKNTIFVIFGDHGLPAAKSSKYPQGMLHHHLVTNHVPLVIHWPGKLSPAVKNEIVSQVDVMPTLAHLAGIPYATRTLGRNIFQTRPAKRKFAFIYVWHHRPYKFGLVGKDFYYVNTSGQKRLFQYQSAEFQKDLSLSHAEDFAQMGRLSDGLYELTKYLLYNNKKID